eukprot:GEMP01114040.1.p1 GENE.GEMP01114040.1~~GEMP01114040.1.p1  ORF type:complete len:118 (-),score=0.91 GEMP01114040.1:207-560(-)
MHDEKRKHIEETKKCMMHIYIYTQFYIEAGACDIENNGNPTIRSLARKHHLFFFVLDELMIERLTQKPTKKKYNVLLNWFVSSFFFFGPTNNTSTYTGLKWHFPEGGTAVLRGPNII